MEKLDRLSTLQRFFLLLQAYKKEVLLTYLYAIFGGLLNLILPLGVQATLNIVQSGTITSSWWFLVFVVALGTLFNGALVIMQNTLNETLQKKIFTDMSFDFATRIPQLDLEKIRGEYLPEVVNRFFETLTLTKGIPKILSDLSTALLQIIFGLILLSLYHPYFIVLGVLLMLVLFFIFRITGANGLKTSIKESKFKYEVVYWLEELGRTILTFKHSANSNYNIKRADKLVSNYLDAKTEHFRILKLQYWSLVMFKTLITLLLLVLGGNLVLKNQISIGQFVASEIIIILIINASEKMILMMDTIYDVLTSLDKVGHVMDLPMESSSSNIINSRLGMSVLIKNVSFNFENSHTQTLSDINLDIRPLERTCIAGYNASGKSTLMQLIASFLKPKQGAVFYDGIPSVNYNLASLRSKIGFYSSSEQVFRGTLKENITLGYEDINDETIIRLLKKVGLTTFVSEITGGLDAMLLPDGKNLSRSIVSKILIARSLAHDPKILIVENLIDNFQSDEKNKIIELITSSERTWTLVCASDDLELAAQCDNIILLEKGKIIDKGTFEELKNSIHFKRVFKVFPTKLQAH